MQQLGRYENEVFSAPVSCHQSNSRLHALADLTFCIDTAPLLLGMGHRNQVRKRS